MFRGLEEKLSQPNNNHNPNNKKLHDTAKIEQNSENKSYLSILANPQKFF